MRFIFFIFILLFSWFGNAQTGAESRIDSLENLLGNLRNLDKQKDESAIDTQKVDVLCLLSKSYDGIDSTKTFDLANEALNLSQELGYAQGFVDANFTYGRALMYIDPKEAATYLERGKLLAEKLMKKDSTRSLTKLWADGTYNLGLAEGYMGSDEKELEVTALVIPAIERLGDTHFLANIHTNLGSKQMDLGDFKKAYPNLVKGRSLYKQLNDPQEATFNVIQLAMAYEGLDSLERMRKTLDEAKLLLEAHPNDFDLFNFGLQESQYYLRVQKPKEALNTLERILYLVENEPNSILYGMLMQRYAEAHAEGEDFTNATTYITKYLNSSKAMGREKGRFNALYKRSQYQASNLNFENAYQDLRKAFEISSTLETANTLAKLQEMNLKFETAENEKEILGLKVKNEEKKSQAYLLVGIISILALLLFSGFYLYKRKLSKVHKKERIREAEVQLLKQEQQNKIFSAMIEGQEKERKRLAIDLHDGLGGRLSGISMNLSKLDKDEPKEYPKQQLQKVMKDLSDSLTELRSVARNMMPETLVKFGLQAALKDYCSSMTGSETKVTLQFYGTDKGITINQQVTMYRVIQELINNAIKHAKATEVLVQYMRKGDQVDITVEDNGIGFDKSKSLKQKGTGMGLSNLQTRVAYLKGNIDFESEENEGTTVNVHLNINAA